MPFVDSSLSETFLSRPLFSEPRHLAALYVLPPPFSHGRGNQTYGRYATQQLISNMSYFSHWQREHE